MMTAPVWMWIGFFAVVVLLLMLDLGLLNRKERDITVRQSLWLSLGYVAASLCFALALRYFIGGRASRDFLTGYFIEKSLSMDNIFVMSMVFAHFYIPRSYQPRVLLWGILGVVLLRGIMIGVGSILIAKFHFILYFFGAFLIITGLRMMFMAQKEEEKSLEENKLLQWLRRRIPVTAGLHGRQFFADEQDASTGRMVRKATPLLLVLIFIELADVVFALDSVPAVFAVTTDPFVVYTSNIFAILGLRALYFALAAMLHRFAYLKYALALVLVFIGGKIFLEPIYKIHSGLSLGVTLGLLFGGVLVSLYKTRKQEISKS